MTDEEAQLQERVSTLQESLQRANDQISNLQKQAAEPQASSSPGYSNKHEEKPITREDVRQAIENYMVNTIRITGGGDIVVVATGKLAWSVSAK